MDAQPNKRCPVDKRREANRRAEKQRQRRLNRFLDCILAMAALSQLTLICFEKLGPGAHHHLSDMADELAVIREKAEGIQNRLKNAARSMGHAHYATEMERRRLTLWQGLKKLLRETSPHE